jgi:hypothetical protein
MKSREELIALASQTDSENEFVDFKREYSPLKGAAFWAETVKDIVAFSNSGGGVLVFGVEDNGTKSDFNCEELLKLDSAKLVDQVRKYTDFNHAGLSISSVRRFGVEFPAIIVLPVSPLLVFTKVGTYEVEQAKQKTAFSLGTIYVRHGSKSEPILRSDLHAWINREVEKQRDFWLSNIRRVVEAEPGSTVLVLNPSQVPDASPVRITNDPGAPIVRLQRLSDQYPFRQTDVIAAVCRRLPHAKQINSHDIQVIKECSGISHETTPHLIHKPHEVASPQYSKAFIDFIVENYQNNDNFFQECRDMWRKSRYGS